MLGVIDTLEEHICMEKEDADIDIVQSSNANTVTCVMPTTNIAPEAVARRRKRIHEAASSVQSIERSPGDTRNAPTRSKKRVKRSPLPVTVQVSQPAPAPTCRTSARNSDDTSRSHSTTGTAQLARASRSTRMRSVTEKERAEEEMGDDDLQAIYQQESTLNDDDDEECGGGEKSVIASPAAPKRRAAPKSFEERFKALMEFKDEFGHCDVPGTKTGEHYILGCWCSNTRRSYKKIQKGEKSDNTLTDDQYRRLEEAGFKWSLGRPPHVSFDEHFDELIKFKQTFGHCNAPGKKSIEFPSVGQWCQTVRKSYKQLQKGEKSQTILTDDHIRRLEEAGFKWIVGPLSISFDEHFDELVKFKQEFGHCNAPKTKSSKYLSLASWCHNARRSYKQIKKGANTTNNKLTDDHIRRLEEVGFQWNVGREPGASFDEHFEKLMKFKQKFRHCNAPQTKSSEYYSLGSWCNTVRRSYKKIQKGEKTRIRLTDDDIRRLDEAGFNW